MTGSNSGSIRTPGGLLAQVPPRLWPSGSGAREAAFLTCSRALLGRDHGHTAPKPAQRHLSHAGPPQAALWVQNRLENTPGDLILCEAGTGARPPPQARLCRERSPEPWELARPETPVCGWERRQLPTPPGMQPPRQRPDFPPGWEPGALRATPRRLCRGDGPAGRRGGRGPRPRRAATRGCTQPTAGRHRRPPNPGRDRPRRSLTTARSLRAGPTSVPCLTAASEVTSAPHSARLLWPWP